MKFGQLIEFNQRNNFIQKSYTKWGRYTSSRSLFVVFLSFISGKSKWSAISKALNLACNKNKLYRTLDYWFRNMLNFEFSEKDLGIVSTPHIGYDFSR